MLSYRYVTRDAMSRVVRRSRLRAEATRVACIVGLRCVAAIFASLRCRRACWCLDANVLCGRAGACGNLAVKHALTIM